MTRTALVIAAVLLLAAGGAGGAGGAGRAGEVAQSQDLIRIGVQRGATYEVLVIPLEEYVARVLAGEALPGSAPAAMDALAIAVRTYTAANLNRHRSEGFDLCDTTHCQVMRTASATTTRAAEATRGQVLLYRGTPATIYYSASCGGHTEVPSEVWPGAVNVPYLPSQPDDGCKGLPKWTAELALADVQRSFAAAGYKGTLRNMSMAERNDSGRISELRLDGLTPNRLSGQDLRVVIGQTMGWQYVRSAAFNLRRTGDVFRFDGQGSGHGVGMCVIGSANLAADGQSAATILNHYYPGTTIGSFTPGGPTSMAAPAPRTTAVVAPATSGAAASNGPAASNAAATAARAAAAPVTGVALTLAASEESERDALLWLVARERDALVSVLGVAAPPRLAVRVHPTSAEYERATGSPWFTNGVVVNNEIHLPPLAPLRERGVLERMLRRQIVHLLVDGTLGKRPAWVREGAALYFGDGQAAAAESLVRPICPTDTELLRPVSAGALSVSFAEARACFERQVTGGRVWRDVR